jgi:hypothetical protein
LTEKKKLVDKIVPIEEWEEWVLFAQEVLNSGGTKMTEIKNNLKNGENKLSASNNKASIYRC